MNRSRYDMMIMENNTSVRILKVERNGSMQLEVTKKGTVSTAFYKGVHWGTSVSNIKENGTSGWEGRFMQITERGEKISGHASGTAGKPCQDGFSKIKGKGIMWTKSSRFPSWNGANFTVNGLINMSKGTTKVFVKIDELKKKSGD